MENPERVTYFAATDSRGKYVPFGIKAVGDDGVGAVLVLPHRDAGHGVGGCGCSGPGTSGPDGLALLLPWLLSRRRARSRRER